MTKPKKTTAFCNYAKKDGYANNCLQEVEEHSINKVYFDAFNWRYLCDNCLKIAPKWSEKPQKTFNFEKKPHPDNEALFYYLDEHAEKHTIKELVEMVKEDLQIETTQNNLRNFCNRHEINYRRMNDVEKSRK